MKPVSFFVFTRRLNLFFGLFFICTQLHSKPFPPSRNKFPSYFFVRPYTQCQYFFYKKQEGILDVKFPYSIVNGNVSTTHTFSSSKSDLTGSGKFSFTFPGIEFGYGRFSAEANMNFVTGPVWGWTDNFYFGLNFRLPSPLLLFASGKLNLPAAPLITPPTYYSPWRVVLHAGIQYYHPLYLLGEISMNDKDHFYATGHTLPNIDTIATGGNVKVYFQQNTISFAPSLELGYQPEDRQIDFGIRIAPLIMISQEGGLRYWYRSTLRQESAPGGYNLQYVDLRSDGIEANYNGEPIYQTPFRLHGFMISVNVGVRLGG